MPLPIVVHSVMSRGNISGNNYYYDGASRKDKHQRFGPTEFSVSLFVPSYGSISSHYREATMFATHALRDVLHANLTTFTTQTE